MEGGRLLKRAKQRERDREREREIGGGRVGEKKGGGGASTFANQYPFPGAVMLPREWLLHYQTERLILNKISPSIQTIPFIFI